MTQSGEVSAIYIEVSTDDPQWLADEMEGRKVATLSVAVANIAKDGNVEDYKVETMVARAATEATHSSTADLVVK